MNKYSTIYFFSGVVLTFASISCWKNRKSGDKKQLTLRTLFLIATILSLVISHAPWIMIGFLSLWLTTDKETLKSMRSAASSFKEDIDLASIGLFFLFFPLFFQRYSCSFRIFIRKKDIYAKFRSRKQGNTLRFSSR